MITAEQAKYALEHPERVTDNLVQAIASFDAKALASQSVPTEMLFSGLDIAVQVATGKTLTEFISSVTAYVSALVSEVSGAVVNALSSIPILGFVIKVAEIIVKAILGRSDEEERAVANQYCDWMFNALRPVPTGFGGQAMPADLFAPVHLPKRIESVSATYDDDAGHAVGAFWDGLWVMPVSGLSYPRIVRRRGKAYRSALAMAYMWTLEGRYMEPWEQTPHKKFSSDLKKQFPGVSQRLALYRYQAKQREALNASLWWTRMAANPTNVKKKPFSNLRVYQYRSLRRSIERAHLRSGSDGGVAAYTAFLDLLRQDQQDGNLSPLYVGMVLNSKGSPFRCCPNDYIEGKNQSCTSRASDAFFQSIDTWDRTVEPVYAQGKHEIDKMRQGVEELARDVGKQHVSGSLTNRIFSFFR